MIMQWDSVMLGLHTGYQEHRGEVAAPFWRRGSEELANVNLCQMKEFRGGQIWADQIAWGKIRRKGVYMNEKQTCGWRNKQVQMSKSFEGCGRWWLPKGCWGGASQVALVVENLPAVQETQETWVRSLGWEDPLEEGMATHSSVLSWRIPWTEEPGRLQSMGSQIVGHNWATHTHTRRMMRRLLPAPLIALHGLSH